MIKTGIATHTVQQSPWFSPRVAYLVVSHKPIGGVGTVSTSSDHSMSARSLGTRLNASARSSNERPYSASIYKNIPQQPFPHLNAIGLLVPSLTRRYQACTCADVRILGSPVATSVARVSRYHIMRWFGLTRTTTSVT